MRNIKRFLCLFTAIFVVAASFSPLVSASSSSSSSANNFSFRSFSGQYYLTRDADNRSVLQIDETLVAEFPDYDQNHGIERAIPVSFDGHPAFYGKLTATRNGSYEPISSTSIQNNYEVFQIGDKNSYVHGVQTYELSYELRDVTYANLADGQWQVFAWQSNGDAWKQLFGAVSATLTIDPALVGSIATSEAGGYARCFSGVLTNFREQSAGDSSCKISKLAQNKYQFTASNVYSSETLAFGIDFKDGTFAPFKMSAGQISAIVFGIILAITLVGALVFLIILAITRGRNAKTNKAIIPQYEPPANLDIVTLAHIYNRSTTKVLTAVLLGLATRGNIKIIEGESKGVFNKSTFSIELVSTDGATDIERQYLSTLFPDGATTFDFSDTKNHPEIGQSLGTILTAKNGEVERSSFYKPRKSMYIAATIILTFAILVMILCLVLFTQPWLAFTVATVIMVISAVLAGTNILMAIVMFCLRPLSVEGAEIRDAMLGLKLFMTVAESERIKILQSTKGTERYVSDGKTIVKLYEKLLPFATIFGIENSWAKVLEVQYTDGTEPSWYYGNAPFNAAVFATSMSSFSSSVNSYSSVSSSSSGGGFSGGGAGGGGGGGGW